MKKDLTWFGHNTWLLRLGETRILIDPFLLPASGSLKEEWEKTDFILVSHGHSDHCGKTLDVVRASAKAGKKEGATVVAIAEIAGWFESKGITKTEPMNIGGSIPIPSTVESEPTAARVFMTPALHSSTMGDGRSGGNSVGFLLTIPKEGGSDPFAADAELRPFSESLSDVFTLYFACDTGLFPAMKNLGAGGLDVAVLPIGDRYTMGPSLSLDAVKLLQPKKVVPCHYGTWPPIGQDVKKWADAVRKWTDAEPLVPKQGETISLD